MVTATPTRLRKHLLGKYPLVPYASDGPRARELLEKIHSEMATLLFVENSAKDPTPEQYAEVDKRRPGWAMQLRTARYHDFRNASGGL